MESRLPSVFEARFRSVVANVLGQCRYVKNLDRLLLSESYFQVRWNRDEVRLENYYLDMDDASPILGICYELTYQVGQILQRQLGSQFAFIAADGNCPQFYFEDYTNHTFILAFPDFLADKMRQLMHYTVGQLPPHVYVIDPSLGISGESMVDAAVQGYQIKSTYDLEELLPSRDRCEMLPFQWFENGYGQTQTLPLGLSQYLLPGVPGVDENQLIVVGFQLKPGDEYPQVLLGSKQPTESYPTIRKDVEEQLSAEHPLKRFLERLRVELAKAQS